MLPLLAGQVFHLDLYTSALTYILAFGLAKAVTNYFAGTLSDRYGRKVCSVWVAPVSAPTGPPTLDAGLAMVRLGMAWWYRAYAREQRPEARGQYESAEHEARAKRVGLWHDPDPMTPWDWRVANRRGGGHQIDGPTPVLQPNTRMILRSNSAVDAEWCRRILWHEGFVFEAMKGRRSATMYLRVLLGY